METEPGECDMSLATRCAMLCAFTTLLAAVPLAAQAPAAAVAQPAAASTLEEGIDEGTTAARAAGTGIWAAGSFLGGLTLGPFGAGLGYALATGSDTEAQVPTGTKAAPKSQEYRLGYQQAYTRTLVAKRKRSALIGGASGTALMVTGALIYLVK